MERTNRSAYVLQSRARWRLDDANPRGDQRVPTRLTPFRIAVADQKAVTDEHTIVTVGEPARDLDHERAVGMWCRRLSSAKID